MLALSARRHMALNALGRAPLVDAVVVIVGAGCHRSVVVSKCTSTLHRLTMTPMLDPGVIQVLGSVAQASTVADTDVGRLVIAGAVGIGQGPPPDRFQQLQNLALALAIGLLINPITGTGQKGGAIIEIKRF